MYTLNILKPLMFEGLGAGAGASSSMAEGSEIRDGKVLRGWLIVGLSLAVLFGVALLKGGADSGGGLD